MLQVRVTEESEKQSSASEENFRFQWCACFTSCEGVGSFKWRKHTFAERERGVPEGAGTAGSGCFVVCVPSYDGMGAEGRQEQPLAML